MATKITTSGLELQIQWKDGTTSWVKLKDIKESNPLQVAEYVLLQKIEKEFAFLWWVKHTIRTRDRIISMLKPNNLVRRGMKFGVVIPKDINHAIELGRIIDNDLWREAFQKEFQRLRLHSNF